MLGGLLSAYLAATDGRLGFANASTPSHERWTWRGRGRRRPLGQAWSVPSCLLSMAVELGHRLLPAFDSNTGIPFGAV